MFGWETSSRAGSSAPFSTSWGLSKALEGAHKKPSVLPHFTPQRCSEAGTAPGEGALSQLEVSEHLMMPSPAWSPLAARVRAGSSCSTPRSGVQFSGTGRLEGTAPALHGVCMESGGSGEGQEAEEERREKALLQVPCPSAV